MKIVKSMIPLATVSIDILIPIFLQIILKVTESHVIHKKSRAWSLVGRF